MTVKMTEEYDEGGLLGPREFLILGVVLLAAYLYKKFSHLFHVPSGGMTLGSAAGDTAVPQNGTTSTDDEARRRQILEARRRLVEDAERAAEVNRQKMKEKEEQRRKELLERKERLLDVNKATSSKAASSLRDDNYNPLMGSASSCGWRPSKKTSARGG